MPREPRWTGEPQCRSLQAQDSNTRQRWCYTSLHAVSRRGGRFRRPLHPAPFPPLLLRCAATDTIAQHRRRLHGLASTRAGGYTLYMGKNKYENENLIAYGWPEGTSSPWMRCASNAQPMPRGRQSVALRNTAIHAAWRRSVTCCAPSRPLRIVIYMCVARGRHHVSTAWVGPSDPLPLAPLLPCVCCWLPHRCRRNLSQTSGSTWRTCRLRTCTSD